MKDKGSFGEFRDIFPNRRDPFAQHDSETVRKMELYSRALKLWAKQKNIGDENWYYNKLNQADKNPHRIDSFMRQVPKPILNQLIIEEQNMLSIWPIPPNGNIPQEGVPLGKISGTNITLCNKHPEQNTVCIARPGGGKSVFMWHYIRECAKKNHKVWYITSKEREAVNLPFDKIIFRLGQGGNQKIPQFYHNFLQPPKGYDLFEWDNNIACMLGSMAGLLDPGIRTLLYTWSLFREKNNGNDFCFKDIADHFVSAKPNSADKNKWERCLSLHENGVRFYGKGSQCITGYDLNELVKHNIVFVLPDSVNVMHLVPLAACYLYFMLSRDIIGIRVPRNPIEFLFEEFHFLVPYRPKSTVPNVFANLAKRGRYVNVGLGGTSHTSNLDWLFLNSVFCFCFKSCSSIEDRLFVQRMCNLTAKQAYEFSTFSPKNGIIKMMDSQPFKVDFPYVELEQVNANAFFKENQEKVEALQTKPVFKNGEKVFQIPTQSTDDREPALLEHIGKCELMKNSKGLYLLTMEQLSFWFNGRPREFREQLDSLIKNGLVNKHILKWRNRSGRPDMIVQLTKKGVQELENSGMTGFRKNHRSYSNAHAACIQAQIDHFKEQGWEIIGKEHRIQDKNGNEKRIDLAVKNPDSGKVTLIETMLSNAPDDVKGLLQDIENHLPEMDALILVSGSMKDSYELRKYLRKNLDQSLLDTVQFEPCSEYFSSWAEMQKEFDEKRNKKSNST